MEYGALFSCGAWNIEEYHLVAVNVSFQHVVAAQEIYIDSALVVCSAPKFFLVFLHSFVCQGVHIKVAAFLFHTKHDGSSVRIGKGGIGLPK